MVELLVGEDGKGNEELVVISLVVSVVEDPMSEVSAYVEVVTSVPVAEIVDTVVAMVDSVGLMLSLDVETNCVELSVVDVSCSLVVGGSSVEDVKVSKVDIVSVDRAVVDGGASPVVEDACVEDVVGTSWS